MDKEGGSEVVSRFSFKKVFCLTVSKNFVQEPFHVSLISGNEKVRVEKLGGGIKIFRRRFFCLTVSKKTVGGIL